MDQDKLEEIARLLGGISDKLDAFAREQQRMVRIAARWDGDGIASDPHDLHKGGALPVPFDGYVAQLDKETAQLVGGTTIVVGAL